MVNIQRLGAVLALSVVALVWVSLFAMVPRALAVHDTPITQDPPLETAVENYLSALNAEYGMAVVNLEDGRSVFVNADRPFPAASLYKLLVMYRVYEAIDAGSLSLDDPVTIQRGDTIQDEPGGWYSPGETTTVRQALDVMITESSNAASFALTRTVGGWGVVESAAAELGMADTYMDGEQFWSTPDDMARFFRLLASWELVSPMASQEMIQLLLAQTRSDRLPALLPEEVSVAHKTGELEDVRNDGGIVYAPRGWYVIVAMSQNGSPDEQVRALAQLSYLVYGAYGSR